MEFIIAELRPKNFLKEISIRANLSVCKLLTSFISFIRELNLSDTFAL
jgi:hypothetical protein